MGKQPDPRAIFQEEAEELLQLLEDSLLVLEQQPQSTEHLNSAFRALHTIKGSATMFGLDSLVKYAHRLENTFVILREGTVPVSRTIVDHALSARDMLVLLLRNGAIPEDRQDHAEELLQSLEAATRGTGEAATSGSPQSGGQDRQEDDARHPSGSPGAATAPRRPHLVRVEYRPSRGTFLHGTNPLSLLHELKELGETMVVGYSRSVPPLEEITPDHCFLAWDILLTTSATIQEVEDVFIFIDGESSVQVEEVHSGEYRRLGEILVDRGVLDSAELERYLADRPPLGEVLVDHGAVSPDSVRSALEEQRLLSRIDADEANATIKVRTGRLDDLVSLVGEFVSLQAQVSLTSQRLDDRELASQAEQLERLVREARDLSMDMHMVPVETLFAPFRRLTREVARELNREVSLSLAGTETELDRNVVEQLRDPLLHIIRNSLDHGIEPPDARLAAGKRRQGQLVLRAGYSGAFVTIAIEDDGKGIDADAVRSKAIERGLISPEATLSREEIFDLVFQPGFSTASVATQVSGRGVGMDVVRRNLEKLNGSVALTSTAGQGTTVLLRIPLTLAIVEGLLCRVADQCFLINLAYIRECLDGQNVNRHASGGFFDYRGSVVPLLDLASFYRFGTTDVRDPVVVVDTGEQLVGLVVREILGNHQSVVKSMGALLQHTEGVSGAVFLPDGTPALMVDVERLARLAMKNQSARE